MASRSCHPPKTVRVKGHWRNLRPVKRKRRKSARAPRAIYYVVADGRGHTCGHHHRTLSGAVACRRRKDRAERAYRGRFGGTTTVWTTERRNA